MRPYIENRLKEMIHILTCRMNSDMNERDLEKLSKAELIKMVEKLQNKARKPKTAIVDDDNGQVPQLQKPTRRISPIQIPIGKPVPAPTIKNRAPKIEKLDQALNPISTGL